MGFAISYEPLRDGRRLAVGALDDAAALNALSHSMAREMLRALLAWREDDSVAAVLLRGGGRHFCAGGNVLDLARHIAARRWDSLSDFFWDEYRLDALLYHYPKVVIGWGSGALMGGGMGVYQGCGLRLVTPDVKVAMPEVHIGLFPDVGAAWFFRRTFEDALGMFLGLSGVALNAFDAVHVNLADYIMPQDSYAAFMKTLRNCIDWTKSNTVNEMMLRGIVERMDIDRIDNIPRESVLHGCRGEVKRCCGGGSAAEMTAALAGAAHPWLRRAAGRLAGASPGAMAFWHRHWGDLRGAGREEVFAASYIALMAFMRDGEFAEGVRALLVDKDKAPKWRHKSLADVPDDWPRTYAEDEAVAARLAAQLKSDILPPPP